MSGFAGRPLPFVFSSMTTFVYSKSSAFRSEPSEAKASGLSTSPDDASSLDAEAAALLADIASFDMEAARRRVQQIDARYTGIRGNLADFSGAGRDLGFPDVTGCMEPGPSTGEPDAEPAPSVQDSPAAQRGGLLDQLRDEVAQRQHGVNVASLDAERLRARLDRSLRAVFDYCRELTTQLNFLQPQVSRCYYLLDSDDPINKLAWQEGYADFRTRANGEGGNIERVSLAYTLQGPGRRTVERAGGAVERLRQMLFDLGMKFECQERRNRLRELESGLFTIADEIKVQAMWRADFEKGQVVLESRNLERLGFVTFTIRPEAIGPELLDEFGRLVLGRENRFRACLAR